MKNGLKDKSKRELKRELQMIVGAWFGLMLLLSMGFVFMIRTDAWVMIVGNVALMGIFPASWLEYEKLTRELSKRNC